MIFEEVIEQDQDYINEVVIPLLNTIRTNRRGEINPYEPQGNKIFITTAGFMGTYAYDKLVETLCYSLIDPKNYIVMGGSYKVLIMHGRLLEETMREILSSPSWKPDQIDREYRSIWSSTIAGAAFSPSSITKLRKIKRAEYRAREATEGSSGFIPDFYVISVDLAKDGTANTAVVIYRVSYGEYSCNYRLVYATSIDTSDYEVVANVLKQMVLDYNAEMLVYDANGVGAGLRDWLNKPTINQNGELMQGLGIVNPPNKEVEDVLIKYREPWRNIVYEIKSGGGKASEIHKIFFAKMSSGAVRLLVKSSEALAAFSKNANFCEATRARKDLIMRPYYFVDQLEQELKNLDIKDTVDSVLSSIQVERRNKNIQKDFFSAAEYGIYAALFWKEMPYYKEKAKKRKQIVAFSTSSADLSSDRRGRSRRVSRR